MDVIQGNVKEKHGFSIYDYRYQVDVYIYIYLQEERGRFLPWYYMETFRIRIQGKPSSFRCRSSLLSDWLIASARATVLLSQSTVLSLADLGQQVRTRCIYAHMYLLRGATPFLRISGNTLLSFSTKLEIIRSQFSQVVHQVRNHMMVFLPGCPFRSWSLLAMAVSMSCISSVALQDYIVVQVVFIISPGFSGHRCASLRISPGIAGHLLFLQARMVARRRSSPGIAGASRVSFFLQDYIVFCSCLTISPGIAGHLWHRCLSCQGHLLWHPWASLRIAGHRIAAYLSWHVWASLVSSQLRMAGYCRPSPGIAGRSWITFFFTGLYGVSFSFHYLSWHRRASRASLRISPGIAGHLSFPWHRCASLGIAAFILQ